MDVDLIVDRCIDRTVLFVHVAPVHLSEADKLLMAEFDRRDIDNSGSLSRTEIEAFLKDMEWASLSADDVFNHYDKDHDESITAHEFLTWQRAAWVHRSDTKTTARVVPILHKMFRQHSGY